MYSNKNVKILIIMIYFGNFDVKTLAFYEVSGEREALTTIDNVNGLSCFLDITKCISWSFFFLSCHSSLNIFHIPTGT